MKTIRVELGGRSYEVYVGSGLILHVGSFLPLEGVGQAVVVNDENALGYAIRVAESIEEQSVTVIADQVSSGEQSKTLARAERLLSFLAKQRVRRNDLLVGVGGGMVGDLVGFAASTYLRGVAYAQVPTTLLAQVDASVGGKTAVNLPEGKNLVGTFWQPSAVIADVGCLRSLPDWELRSGLAEVAKYGFCLDPRLLEMLEGSRDRVLAADPEVLEALVARCVELKAAVVAADERDLGDRRVLNYGHTIGHALETFGGYRGWTHGQAISVGMVAAAHLARELGFLGEEEVVKHVELLGGLGLPTSARFDADEVVRLTSIDKKHGVQDRWVLLKGIGAPVVESGVDLAAVRRALEAVAR